MAYSSARRDSFQHVMTLIKGAKLLDPILYFTHLNSLIFMAKTDLYYLQCVRTTTTVAAHRLAYGLATS